MGAEQDNGYAIIRKILSCTGRVDLYTCWKGNHVVSLESVRACGMLN
jgi:hypothetical protein